jgi:hypothetical protein
VDFVVVGFGLGALGVLLGVVMLGWLAPRAQRAAARVSSPDDAARCQAVAAEHRGTGQSLLYSGGVMFLATVAGLAGSLDDRTGAFLVTTTATVAAVGILLAGYLQRARNPVPPRRRTRVAATATASMVTIPPPVPMPSFLADESSWVEHPAPTEGVVEDLHTAILPTGDSVREAILTEDSVPPASAVSGELSSDETDTDPLGDSSIAVETTGSGSWQLADHASDNGSEETASAQTVDAQNAGQVAPTARLTEPSASETDEEDPSSGHQS